MQLTTTDGAKVDVECVVSDAFQDIAGASPQAGQVWALEEGRFVGQVILQLGGKTSRTIWCR